MCTTQQKIFKVYEQSCLLGTALKDTIQHTRKAHYIYIKMAEDNDREKQLNNI